MAGAGVIRLLGEQELQQHRGVDDVSDFNHDYNCKDLSLKNCENSVPDVGLRCKQKKFAFSPTPALVARPASTMVGYFCLIQPKS